MFGNPSVRRSDLAKLDVLETKFEMYEDLSKSMLEKLDGAVTAIQENSNKIALVLEKHDNRIAMNEKFDQEQIERIKDIRQEIISVKASNTLEHAQVVEKIESLELRMESFAKWRWQATAIIGCLVFLATIGPDLLQLFEKFNHNHSNHISNVTTFVEKM